MTEALDPIQAALAASQAAAKAAPVPALVTPASTAIAAPTKLSMDSMAAGGMSVDKWFKVNEDGIKIGDSKLIPKPVKATIDMTEGAGFILKYGIKGGNPAQYGYTTDLATAQGGGSWEAAQARVRVVAPSATPYRCVDLPFTLSEDVTDMTKANVGKAGDVVGYTTPTTNWANWVTFHKEVADAGLMGSRVEVSLTSQARTNKNGNNWGVLKMDLIGPAE